MLIHNNNGVDMRKIFLIFLFFIIFDVHASDIYISKRDKDTYDFVHDCDFLLYDSFGNLVDSWVQGNEVHVSSVEKGVYSLVERPLSVGFFNSDLNKVYKLDVSSDDDFQVTLFNKEIDTPDNLGSNNNYFYCYFLIILGFGIIFYGKYKVV